MDDFFGRDGHVTQVIYADGYGAMFFIDSDIDAFSKGELDFNEFYERTQLLANWSGSTSTTSMRGTTSLGFDAFGR